MKILFIVPSYKPAYGYGGTVVVIAKLAEGLVKLGHRVTVYTTTANGTKELDVVVGREILVDGVAVRYFNRITKDHTNVSPALWHYLIRTVKNFDVVHIHSWWNFVALGAAWVCKRKNIRPVISPHGMFSDFIMQSRNSIKKKLIHKLIGANLLRNATITCTTNLEKKECESLIPGSQATQIFNMLQFPKRLYEHAVNRVFKIGFLSRLHEKKGLDLLIKALSKVDFKYKLYIAGEGESKYVDYLKSLADKCGNSEQLEWVGWIGGEEKFEFLSQLDLFALTSHNENFAVVITEALSVGTPVLVSNMVGLHDYVLEKDLGWVCGLDEYEILSILERIYNEQDKIKLINKTSPNIVRADFEESYIAEKYIQLYKSVSPKG